MKASLCQRTNKNPEELLTCVWRHLLLGVLLNLKINKQTKNLTYRSSPTVHWDNYTKFSKTVTISIHHLLTC